MHHFFEFFFNFSSFFYCRFVYANGILWCSSLLSIVFVLFKNVITRDGLEDVIRTGIKKNKVISKWEFGVTLRETYYHATAYI